MENAIINYMERKRTNEEKFYEDFLPQFKYDLSRFLNAMFSPPKRGKRTPVDCVAFSAACVESNNDEITDYFHAICNHPDRGQTYGCMLTREEPSGRVVRIMGKECPLRIKKGRKGSAKLRERIQKKSDEIPF